MVIYHEEHFLLFFDLAPIIHCIFSIFLKILDIFNLKKQKKQE